MNLLVKIQKIHELIIFLTITSCKMKTYKNSYKFGLSSFTLDGFNRRSDNRTANQITGGILLNLYV